MRTSKKSLLQRATESRQSFMQPLESRLMMSATYHVTTLADETTNNSTTSLREAIALANAHPGSTIILDKTGTYTLSNFAGSGETELQVTANVTISSGNGNRKSYIIDGAFSDRVFDITGSALKVNFNNFTIADGLVDSDGGGVNFDVSGGTLALSGIVFSNNDANGDGGGLFVAPDNIVTTLNTDFNNNISGEDGGGFAYLGTNLTASYTGFTGNQSGGNGGGLFFEDDSLSNNSPTLKLQYVKATNNIANFFGGGVYFALRGGVEATVVAVKPAVIPVETATVSISNSNFTNNTSGNEGGGLYVTSFVERLINDVQPAQPIFPLIPINVAIHYSSFSQNFGSSGGGAFCEDVNSVNIDHTTFTNNKGSYSGGGLTVYDTDLTTGDRSVKVIDCEFLYNSASSGGGIFVDEAQSVTVDYTAICFNRATYQGGGIYYESGDRADPHPVALELKNDSISTNTAAGGSFNDLGDSEAGGGVFFRVEATSAPVVANIMNNQVTYNSVGGEGGGMYLEDDDDTQSSMLNLVNNTFSYNTATGAGLNFGGGTGGEGGGLYVDIQGEVQCLTVDKSTYNFNRATENGGAVYLELGESAETDITNSTFNNNQAANDGGGIALGSNTGSDINLYNSTITSNSAGNSGGGLYADSGASINMFYDTIALNRAFEGGGVFNSNDTIFVMDTIIATNTVSAPATNGPDAAGTFNDDGHNFIGVSDGSFGFTVSTLVGTSANKKNPLLKPLAFNGGPTQTMAEPTNGPADNQGIPVLGLTTDQRGVTRSTTHPTIGAYEA
jgi:CSLREA domain-containing protein